MSIGDIIRHYPDFGNPQMKCVKEWVEKRSLTLPLYNENHRSKIAFFLMFVYIALRTYKYKCSVVVGLVGLILRFHIYFIHWKNIGEQKKNNRDRSSNSGTIIIIYTYTAIVYVTVNTYRKPINSWKRLRICAAVKLNCGLFCCLYHLLRIIQNYGDTFWV